MEWMSSLPKLQSLLRYLVVFQVSYLPLSIIASVVCSVPEEITVAQEVMEEVAENQMSGVAGFFALSLVLVALVLLTWSLWQLYHLDKRGVAKYIWLCVTGIVWEWFYGEGWFSGPESALEELYYMSGGALICLCLLCPEIFTKPIGDIEPEVPGNDVGGSRDGIAGQFIAHEGNISPMHDSNG